MTDAVETRFVERLKKLLVSLPYDLKALFEVMSDEDLTTEARELATGAVIYCLSPVDPIPDHTGLVGFTDDVIAVRLVLQQLLEIGGENVADYPERFPEQFDQLEDDLQLFRKYLGESMGWLERRMVRERLHELRHKGKLVAMYVKDDELGQRLYEDGLEFTTEYEIDDDAVQRLTSGKPVLEAFERRQQLENARRVG